MNLDLTAATEAAKTAAFLCGVREQRDEFIIAAAAPLIAAQVAEQIAAAIEEKAVTWTALGDSRDENMQRRAATLRAAARVAREAVR